MFELIGNAFGFVINILFYQPTFNILILFYKLFGGNLGLAILVIAAIAKLITIPITQNQIKSAEKMKVFQQKSAEVRKKYAKNTEKMNDELMKLSSKYMPAQLSGCLPLIITLVLLIQVRAVVINLVNQGYHAFNEVAYMQSFKIPEDHAKFITEPLSDGEHTIQVDVKATNGNELKKDIKFFVVNSEDEGKTKVKDAAKAEQKRVKELSKEDKQKLEDEQKKERETEIAVYVTNFKKGSFTTDKDPELEVQFRAPSKQNIAGVTVSVDGKDYTSQAEITKGEALNFEFLGMNLSRVGRDFYGNWGKFIPYILLALFLGLSQYFTTSIQMSTQQNENAKKKDNTKPQENMDFSEAMQESSKQMAVMMPLMTMAISLGYLGGSSLFPAGVSVFWTAQNAFVIIQLAITKKEDIQKWVTSKLAKFNIKKDTKEE